MKFLFVCIFILVGLLVPAGVIAESDDGYYHGSLFTAPKWLVDNMNEESKEMSQLDYYGTALQEPTQKPPTYADYIKEGWGYLEGGNNKDAQKSFEKAIDLNGTSTDAWYGRGLALENQKRYLSAIDAYTKATSFSKKPATSWGPNAGMGRSYLALQQFENAKEALTAAASQYAESGDSQPDEIASIYRDLAQALEMLGETNAAQDALEKAG